MSMSNESETAFLNLLFKNIAWANIGDASGLQPSGTTGTYYASLHTASPGEGGGQNTNEISYTGYARVAVARNTGFTVSGNNVTNAGAIAFGACTAGSGTAAYVGIGTDSSGAGHLVCYAQVSSPVGGLAISAGITPNISIGNLDFNAD